MRRCLLAAAACALLALGWNGVASAGGFTPVGPVPVVQSAAGGDQSSEQSNESKVTQEQGNGNVNVSPAVAVFGDASTSNEQGDGNVAIAKTEQSNSSTQTQSADQQQVADGSSCGCASSDPSQSAAGGDQSSEQSNVSKVTQEQGNGNVNVSPAISLFGGRPDGKCSKGCRPDENGGASTSNQQGNGNVAGAWVSQSNWSSQSERARQRQLVEGWRGGCCRE